MCRNDYEGEADLIDAARESGKIAIYRFHTDELRITALLEPLLESQNSLQSLSDSQLADHIAQNNFAFDSHQDFAVIFQAWIRESRTSNTPREVQDTSEGVYSLRSSHPLLSPLRRIFNEEDKDSLKQDIRKHFSIRGEILKRLSERGYSPEYVSEIDRSLFLTHDFYNQLVVVLRMPSEIPLGELSDQQLSDKIALYSAIRLDDTLVRNEPHFQEAFQRLSGRGYSPLIDDYFSLFDTDDLPSRIIMALSTPNVPIEELTYEGLARRIDFYPYGQASSFVRLSEDQHVEEGLKRVVQQYSPDILQYINDAPTLSWMLRLLDEAVAVQQPLDLHRDVNSIFKDTEYEQLERIEALINHHAETGHWSLDFYTQQFSEGDQLSGRDLLEQFRVDFLKARAFIEVSLRLSTRDVNAFSINAFAYSQGFVRDDEQLERIEALVNRQAETGRWSIVFYEQQFSGRLADYLIHSEFEADVQVAEAFIEGAQYLSSEDVKGLPDRDLARRINLGSPSQWYHSVENRRNYRSLHYPLSGPATRLTGIDRYIKEGLRRVSAYYSEGVIEHIDSTSKLTSVLRWLDESRGQATEIQQLSDTELGNRINALNFNARQVRPLTLIALIEQQAPNTPPWNLDFYVQRLLPEGHQLSGMNLIRQFNADIQTVLLLVEGINRIPSPAPNHPYLYLDHTHTMAQNLTRLGFLVDDLGFDRAFALRILRGKEMNWLARHPLPEDNAILAEIDAQMSEEKPKSTLRIESLWLDHTFRTIMGEDDSFASQVNAITENKEPNVVIKQRLIRFVASWIMENLGLSSLGVAPFALKSRSDQVRVLEETEFIKSRFPILYCKTATM